MDVLSLTAPLLQNMRLLQGLIAFWPKGLAAQNPADIDNMHHSRTSTRSPAMQLRIKYLPIESAEIGMVLGDKVTDNHLRVLLPPGAILSEENLHQMLAHQVEFVCVAEPDTRSADELSSDLAFASKRLEAVFYGADLNAPLTKSLFEQLLIYRSA